MKHYLRTIADSLLIALTALVLTACPSSDDDNDAPTSIDEVNVENGITGTWKIAEVEVWTDAEIINGKNPEFDNPLALNAIVTFSKNGDFIDHTNGKHYKWQESLSDKTKFILNGRNYSMTKNLNLYIILQIGSITTRYRIVPASANDVTKESETEVDYDGYWPPDRKSIKGVEAVDLGLSVKWAPSDMGYFSYLSLSAIPPTRCQFSDYRATKRDVARVRWGDFFRLPTKEEGQELLDKCKWEKLSTGGYKITGPNGNSIKTNTSGGTFMGMSTMFVEDTQFGCYGISSGKMDKLVAYKYIKNEWQKQDYSLYYHAVYERSSDPITAAKEVDLGLSVIWSGYNLAADKVTSPGIRGYWGIAKKIESSTGIAGTVEDRARQIMGNGWRYPTKEEALELIRKCKWELVTVDKYNGYKITGPSGKSIFMPYVSLGYTDARFQYWLADAEGNNVYYLCDDGTLETIERNGGGIKAVRPVKSK